VGDHLALDRAIEHWRPSAGWGRTYVFPARLALSRDPRDVRAWIHLSIMLGDTHVEALAALVLEHAAEVAAADGLSEDLALVESQLLLCQWELAFARYHKAGESVPLTAFGNRSDFEIDEARYAEWLREELEPFAGSFALAAAFALRLAAIRTGALSHLNEKQRFTDEELFDPSLWVETEAYRAWAAAQLAEG